MHIASRTVCSLFLFMCASLYTTSTPRLLVKIVPQHSTAEQLIAVLDAYYKNLSGSIAYQFIITYSPDTVSMLTPECMAILQGYPNLLCSVCLTPAVSSCYNHSIDSHSPFDILIIATDTAAPCQPNYDLIIVDAMQKAFPFYDGIVHFIPQQGTHYAALHVIGKKFFDQFGYIYHPDYESALCIKELITVARMIRKEQICSDQIIAPIPDTPQRKNHSTHDELIFQRRQAQFFGLEKSMLDAATPKVWSILICTLHERAEQFERLCKKLQNQIEQLRLSDTIEILYFNDNRENSVGFKRNALLRASQGKYVCYVDDDDDIHDQYIEFIYNRLIKNPDCLSLAGIITFDGISSCHFIHSLQYDYYFDKDGVYFRPPNHLNPIRRSIAVQFSFPERNFEEDTDWAMQLARSKLLKTEEIISEPYYFYHYQRNKK